MSKSFQNSNCQQAKARRYVVFYKEWGYMSLLGPLKIYVNKKKSAVCRPISKKMKNQFEKKMAKSRPDTRGLLPRMCTLGQKII